MQTTPIGGIVSFDDLHREFVDNRGWKDGSLRGHLNAFNEATVSGNEAYQNGSEVVTNLNMPRESYKRIR